MDRMFCYLWWEKTNPNEAKFGERWVFAGQDPEKEIWKRIKSSLGVRKDLIKDGTVILETYWDVTELAKKVGRYYQRSRMDDFIRPRIGFRKGSTGEIHELSASEIKLKVDKYLAKVDQPLPIVGLSRNQSDALENVLNAKENFKKTIVAELCARFGKTIWSGALIKETASPLTVIVSYVLTSFASFEKDLSGFDQFKDFVVIDTADNEYQEVISAALSQNKQVVAFLSMCVGSKRQEKIDFLFGQTVDRLVIVDEADFGVHRLGQAEPLQNAVKENDTVILMTGTNADKASSIWNVDHYLSVTYPELVIEKKLKRQDQNNNLKYFKVDSTRHELVVDVEFYQMDLKGAVEQARQEDQDLFVENGIFLPSWSKYATNPIKAKGFGSRIAQALFEGKHNLDELNVDYQTNAVPDHRVAMIFFPGSTTNKNLEVIAKLWQDALKGFLIVPIYGEEMTNREAESRVKESIEIAKRNSQSVLLISAGMAQRSFSVGEITELYLAYDSGDSGATIQKISRALTPNQQGKIGRIISLSFDPNRDDKFDELVLVTAENYKKTHNVDIKQALSDVLRTVDIFKCSPEGSVKILKDEYLEQVLENGSLTRVIGKISDLSKLSFDEIQALAEGNVEVYHAAKSEVAAKGKTRAGNSKKGPIVIKDNTYQKTLAEAKKMITTLVENLDILTFGTSSVTIVEALEKIKNNEIKQQEVKKHFGIDFEIINDLFERKIINVDMVQLLEKEQA